MQSSSFSSESNRAPTPRASRHVAITHQPHLDDLSADPHGVHHRIRLDTPVAWIDALDGWLVVGRDAALTVLRNSEHFTVDDPRFSTAQVVGQSMLSTDGAQHVRHRTPFVDPFRSGAIRADFTSWTAQSARELIDSLPTPGPIELRTQFAGPLAAELITRTLDLTGVETADVLRWYRAIVTEVEAISAGSNRTPTGRNAFSELSTVVEETIRRSETSLPRSAARHLSTAEVASNVAVLMFGAIETSEGMSANLLHHLLTNPGQLTAVQQNRELLSNALEESLRLEPAATVVHRYATTDVDLAGAAIRCGDFVSVSLAGANRDPDTFADPDRFDVRRPNARQHLAFATGPHACLGSRLARIETHVGVACILDQRPAIRRIAESSHEPAGLIFRKPEALWVEW